MPHRLRQPRSEHLGISSPRIDVEPVRHELWSHGSSVSMIPARPTCTALMDRRSVHIDADAANSHSSGNFAVEVAHVDQRPGRKRATVAAMRYPRIHDARPVIGMCSRHSSLLWCCQ